MSSAAGATLNAKATSKGNTSGQNETNSRPPLLRYAAAGNLNRSPAQRRRLASRMFSPQKSALESALDSAELEYTMEGSSNNGINYNAKIAKADAEGFPDVAAFWREKQAKERDLNRNLQAFLAEHHNVGGGGGGATVATGAAAYEEGGYRRKYRKGSRTTRHKRSRRGKTRRGKTRR